MMSVAAFVAPDPGDGSPRLGLQFEEGALNVGVVLADAKNVDDVIKTLVRGLKEAAADLKREASGLIIPDGTLEVPHGFRKS